MTRIIFVKLRSRSGESQVNCCSKNSKLKDLDLSYTINLVLRGLDKSDGPRMGWYDSGMVKGQVRTSRWTVHRTSGSK